MNIGDTVYIFDVNRRIYIRPDGTKSNGPLYEGYFVPCVIESFVKRSAMVSQGRYAFKVGLSKLITEDQKKDRIWVHENRWRLAEHVQRKVTDVSTLKAIAKLAGYEPK